MRLTRMVCCLLATALVACEDNSSSPGELDHIAVPAPDAGTPAPAPDEDPEPDPEPEKDPDPDPDVDPDPDPGEDPPELPPIDEARRLVLEGANRVSVLYGERLELRVRYLDGAGEPQQGSIDARLLDGSDADRTEAGIGGSFLADTEVEAGADGRATIQLDAGALQAIFRVRASAELADPVDWIVTVTHPPTGGVEVRVTYADDARYAVADFGGVEVVLVEHACEVASTLPIAALDPVAALPAIAPFDGDDVAAGDGLAHGAVLAAVAYGTNLAGAPLARGCADGLEVGGGAVAQAEVALSDLPLDFKGVYAVEHQLDLRSMLDARDDVGELPIILDILGAVGGGLGQPPFPRGDGLMQLACRYGEIAEAECALLRLVAAPLVESFFDEAVPPEVLEVLDAIGDVYRILAELRVLGEIELSASRPDAEGRLPGNESRWNAFRFAWRLGCPFDLPEQCQRDFDLEAAGIGRRTLVGVFDAELGDGDLLHIEPHTFGVHFGRLAVALLETWILPAILGEDGPITLHEYLGRLIPCADINAALPPGDPNSGVCEATIVDPLADELLRQVEGLGGFEAFTFEGTVTVAEAVPDLSVDRLLDGRWDGTFGDDDALVPDVGTFEGCRVGQCDEDLAP